MLRYKDPLIHLLPLNVTFINNKVVRSLKKRRKVKINFVKNYDKEIN